MRFPAIVGIGLALIACSSGRTAGPQGTATGPARSVVAARVIADDPRFDAAAANAPRFVACQGLSGCARTAPDTGERYPGVILPAGADQELDYTIEFVLYLIGARFVQADLAGDTLHVEVTERTGGFQMVKLDGRRVFAEAGVRVSFEERGRVICLMGTAWEGCNG